jgi:D-alanyl-D-alanine carboxypeptidase/D-alanyl-D-alanine-endopeptidase (penicillin-binding protein 4)
MKRLFQPPAYIFIISILLVFNSCSATKKLSKNFDDSFENSEAFKKGIVGFIVYDPEFGKVLYEHNSEKNFTPASNTKLFTFYTGLKILGDSVPAIKYGIHNDSLVFKGTGDPTFLHHKFSDSKVLEFFDKRKEKLLYVLPNFTEEFFGPGWAWDDYKWYYAVERGDFPIYGNFVKFTFEPGNSIPNVEPSFFNKFIEIDSTYAGKTSLAIRNFYGNKFVSQHSLESIGRVQEVPFKYSPELAVDLLSDTLNKPVKIIKKVPKHFLPLKTLYSIPTDSLYKRMLQESDNFFAEQILLMSAEKISDTLKTQIAIDYMIKEHLKVLPDEIKWVDGSGLSVYNLFTPRTMVKLLELISEEVPRERLFKLLPVGGQSGTLKNFYKAETPYIFAKTGTLSNTHTLSGFLKTKKGKILIFSFMNDNYTIPTSRLKQEMERMLKNIHENF